MKRTLKIPSWRRPALAISTMELSKEYGPSANSNWNWVKKHTHVEVNGESISADELKKLRKDIAIFKEDLEILKRAAVLMEKD